ncbi:fimbrial protein StgD [Enterobacter hormaechei]|uniref:fimbrial protein StgD n=1 Tax=Enterobacter hormaechei TaxID=158836 RepID=UPI00321F151E
MTLSSKRLFLIITLLCLAGTKYAFAGDGTCHAYGGTYIYNLNVNNQQIPADKNKAGVEMRDLESLTSSSSYKVWCNCITRYTATFREIYYTATSPLNIDTTRNDYTYYILNDNLSIATSIFVLGRNYIPVPFSAEPNRVISGMRCYAMEVEPNLATLDTGSSVKLSFLVNKPFIGKVTVPGTIVADLYGGIDEQSSLASTDKLAEIRISGDIVAPQNCEIAAGQSLEIDFGKIPATAFSAVQGTPVSSHKVTKTILVQCTGIRDENIVYSSLHADPVDSSATMMKVNGNDDVGIVIYDKADRAVNVNGGSMSMDRGVNNQGAETNSLTFSAAPASATGAQPRPGTFDAYATITLEIAN